MWRASGRSLTGIVILNHLDLFSGIGGFSLGLERTGGFRTIGFCETDAYCTKVLQKNFPGIPLHGDIRELKGTDFGAVDIITGGYPCQPFSVAGKQKGVEDPRHLWPEMFRVVKESRPTWVIGENVAGHIKLGLDSVLKDLESEGYRTRTFSVSASSIGANHQRERIWIVSYSNSHTKTKRRECSPNEKTSYARKHNERRSKTNGGERYIRETGKSSSEVSNSNSRLRGRWRAIGESGTDQKREFSASQKKSECGTQDIRSKVIGCHAVSGETENWWQTFSKFHRIPDGISYELDKDRAKRIKALGNSLVPHIPYYIGQSIIATYENNDTVQTEGTSKDNT